MQTAIKLAGSGIAPGQISFYRSAFAIVPIVVYLAWRGELRQAIQTDNPFGHVKRGFLGVCAMGAGFFGLVHLPLRTRSRSAMPCPDCRRLCRTFPEGDRAALSLDGRVRRAGRGVDHFLSKLTLFADEGLGSEAAVGPWRF